MKYVYYWLILAGAWDTLSMLVHFALWVIRKRRKHIGKFLLTYEDEENRFPPIPLATVTEENGEIAKVKLYNVKEL